MITRRLTAVSDTSPLNYLIQIRHVDLLPRLFRQVVVPGAVRHELLDVRAPTVVSQWMKEPPDWIQVVDLLSPVDPELSDLGAGESAAITIMGELSADVILIDERMGREAAARRGLRLSGTLGIFHDAHNLGWIDGWATYLHLRASTSFRCSAELEQSFRTLLFGR